MHDAVVVQVLQSKYELIRQLLHPLLTEVEVPCLEVVEEVGALHVVKDDVVVLAILKDVHKVDDVGMLAHFENFYLSPLLEHLNMCHIFLLDLFYCHLLSSLFVHCELY